MSKKEGLLYEKMWESELQAILDEAKKEFPEGLLSDGCWFDNEDVDKVKNWFEKWFGSWR